MENLVNISVRIVSIKNYLLPQRELLLLRKAHRDERLKKRADKIKTVYLLGSGAGQLSK